MARGLKITTCHLQGLGIYEIYEVQGNGEHMDLVFSSDKEAAKLFALYLDRKVSLPKLEESGKGLEVNISNATMSCKYGLWRAQENVYAEAIYFQTVGRFSIYNLIDIFI